jgi:hypothetical protein
MWVLAKDNRNRAPSSMRQDIVRRQSIDQKGHFLSILHGFAGQEIDCATLSANSRPPV